MPTLSIRGVDDQLANLLKKEAAAEKKSMNQLVLETLQKHVGLTKKKKFAQKYHDLDPLFGKWSKNEFNTIQNKINSERKIDEELWK